MSSSTDHKISFLANVMSHNASVISLIDTKAGLILGSVAVLLSLLALLDVSQLDHGAKAMLSTALALFCSTAAFSFLTILPRITKRTTDQTCIFYTSITKLDKKEYLDNVESITSDRIIADYADNIHALAAIQDKKVKMLACALWSMMASIAMVAAMLIVHTYAGSEGGSW